MLTSSSHRARKTFSSKLGSTKLAEASLGMVDRVSLLSTVTGMLSRRLETDGKPSESELDLGGGEDGFRDIGVCAGEIMASCTRLPEGWKPPS